MSDVYTIKRAHLCLSKSGRLAVFSYRIDTDEGISTFSPQASGPQPDIRVIRESATVYNDESDAIRDFRRALKAADRTSIPSIRENVAITTSDLADSPWALRLTIHRHAGGWMGIAVEFDVSPDSKTGLQPSRLDAEAFSTLDEVIDWIKAELGARQGAEAGV